MASVRARPALKLLEQRLGTCVQREFCWYLRCRFMVFDPKEVGKIDMADLAVYWVCCGNGVQPRRHGPREATRELDVDGDGTVMLPGA